MKSISDLLITMLMSESSETKKKEENGTLATLSYTSEGDQFAQPWTLPLDRANEFRAWALHSEKDSEQKKPLGPGRSSTIRCH